MVRVARSSSLEQDLAIGLGRAKLTLTNLLTQARISVSALVDTGAMHMCVTAAQARQLGFDPKSARPDS